MEMGRTLSAACSQERPPRLDVGGHVCAAETIDRLLGVADQKESTWPDLKLGPVVARRAGRRLPTKPPEDFGLERVGVLELIDKDMREPCGKGGTHRIMVAQQVASGENQIIKVKESGGALVVAKAFDHGLNELDDLSQNARCDGL